MSEEKRAVISDICPFYKEYGSCEQCNTALDVDDPPCYFECMANAIIDNNYRKQGWISVEERLPDPFHTVLVYDTHTECVRISLYRGPEEIWRNGRISHWMPFPEPPKMKGGAE